MDITQPCPLAVALAASIRDASVELTELWLERIAARMRDSADSADHDFPSDELLDHMPILMDGIAAYLEDPTDLISADVPVVAEAMELGELRLNQGFDASDILEEYEILGDVLFSFAARSIPESGRECSADDMLVCSHRIFRAVSAIEQVTTAHYMRVLGERVAEREERLRRFNRMITHELKNRVGATLGAGQLLQEEWLGTAERTRFAGMVADNARAIQKVIENLTALSSVDAQRRRQRNIALSEVVDGVISQLRGLARARGVELRVVGDMPELEVNAAAVELSLSNYLSNSIKYSDPAARPGWAEVSAAVEPLPDDAGEQLVVRVRDNGLGVPEDARHRLFERFFRAHTDSSVEGTGLGLNIVQETMAARGGRAWAEFDDPPGAVFAFSLPCEDAESAEAEAGGVSDAAGAATSNGGGRQPDAAPARASD